MSPTQIKNFKKREAEVKDPWHIRKLAEEIAEAGDEAWARKLYIKSIKTAEKSETLICYGKNPIIFGEDDVYIIDSITINEKSIGSESFSEPSLWIKGEKWEWLEIVDSEDYSTQIYVFNRSDGFGIFSSDDKDYIGLRSVDIKYRRIKSQVLKKNNFSDITAKDLEEDLMVCNYGDIMFNNFMIAGQFLLHQKHGEDASGILGEKNPWCGNSADMNRDIFNAFDKGQVKYKDWEALESGEDGQEEIESGDFNDSEMFRWWGRCEGNVNEIIFGGEPLSEPPLFYGNYSMDYVQVIFRVAAVEEKSHFDVELTSVGENKFNVIKVIREITSLGLKEAKEIADSAPVVVRGKEAVVKYRAEVYKKKLEDAGAIVTLK